MMTSPPQHGETKRLIRRELPFPEVWFHARAIHNVGSGIYALQGFDFRPHRLELGYPGRVVIKLHIRILVSYFFVGFFLADYLLGQSYFGMNRATGCTDDYNSLQYSVRWRLISQKWRNFNEDLSCFFSTAEIETIEIMTGMPRRCKDGHPESNWPLGHRRLKLRKRWVRSMGKQPRKYLWSTTDNDSTNLVGKTRVPWGWEQTAWKTEC